MLHRGRRSPVAASRSTIVDWCFEVGDSVRRHKSGVDDNVRRPNHTATYCFEVGERRLLFRGRRSPLLLRGRRQRPLTQVRSRRQRPPANYTVNCCFEVCNRRLLLQDRWSPFAALRPAIAPTDSSSRSITAPAGQLHRQLLLRGRRSPIAASRSTTAVCCFEVGDSARWLKFEVDDSVGRPDHTATCCFEVDDCRLLL